MGLLQHRFNCTNSRVFYMEKIQKFDINGTSVRVFSFCAISPWCFKPNGKVLISTLSSESACVYKRQCFDPRLLDQSDRGRVRRDRSANGRTLEKKKKHPRNEQINNRFLQNHEQGCGKTCRATKAATSTTATV